MKTEAKHTALPWKTAGMAIYAIENWHGGRDDGSQFVAQCISEHTPELSTGIADKNDSLVSEREALANAALICRAVNHFEEMREVLAECARWLDVLPIEYRNRPNFPGAKARTLLSKL